MSESTPMHESTRIKVGDWIEPWDRELDPRECAKVEGDSVWIWLFGPEPAGPFLRDNYIISTTKEEREGIIDDMVVTWDGKGSIKELAQYGHVHDEATGKCLKRRRAPQCPDPETKEAGDVDGE